MNKVYTNGKCKKKLRFVEYLNTHQQFVAYDVVRRILDVVNMRICELKQKEVINVCDCKRLGYVGDVEFDIVTGCIIAIIVPGPGHICGFLGRETEYIIPFCKIKQIGEDIILVDIKEEEVLGKCKF